MPPPKRSTIIPWESCVFEEPIANELNRRRLNRSFNYVEASKGGWDTDENIGNGEWKNYKGPMSPFVRLCSNSMGPEFKTNAEGNYVIGEDGKPEPLGTVKSGFVLFGGKEFYTGYGFKPNGLEAGTSIIGYLPDGIRTHTIDNDLKSSHYPVNVPPPDIERVTVKIQKELYRQATVEWVCFSKKQLEYMTPYFLIPGISCILEWGWNHFNSNCLLNLDNPTELKELNNNPYPLYTDHILKSNGNYDVLMGRITNFDWTVEGNKIKCTTEITSQDRIYSGLMIDSVSVYKTDKLTKEKEENDSKIFNNLTNFIKEKVISFKAILTLTDPIKDSNIGDIVKYIKDEFPSEGPKKRESGTTWEEYVYGVFYGRDPKFHDISTFGTSPTQLKGYDIDRSADDFDYQNDKKALWINMGLVIEIINFHNKDLTSVKGDQMFRIDIDDVIITAHPNLISCDSGVLLIPNAAAPRYFWGKYALGSYAGFGKISDRDYTFITALKKFTKYNNVINGMITDPNDIQKITDDYNSRLQKYFDDRDKKAELKLASDIKTDNTSLRNSSIQPIPVTDIVKSTETNSSENTSLADYRLSRVCGQFDLAYRDNLDEFINSIRRDKSNSNRKFEFPAQTDILRSKDAAFKYPRRRTGYLKDLYINVDFLLKTSGESTTYVEFIDKLLKGISKAAGEFWDLKVDSGPGHGRQKKGEAATLKIVDTKLIVTENKGNLYSFDYFDADSLLLGCSFKPMLTTAQAIRAIYAPVNRPDKHVSMISGTSELLEYKFRDRLVEDDINKNFPPKLKDDSFATMMVSVQSLKPESVPDNPKLVCQMTTGEGKNQIIRRLAISPSRSQILKLLLDDGDEEFNPKYNGVMPGIEATFTIQGIGGLRTFMMFLVKNFPEPYSEKNIIFRITNVQETIEAGKWITVITAGILPFRKHIKSMFGIK